MLLVSPSYLRTAELRLRGYTRATIRHALDRGDLIRVRRGRYVWGGVHESHLVAARSGGRLDCVSLLGAFGVFVLSADDVHLQFDRTDSRLPRRHRGIRAHWRESACARADLQADLVEALAQACRCQPPRVAVASLDSALHLGLIDGDDLDRVFDRLPRRYRPLRKLIDARAEAGSETLVRLMLRSMGYRPSLQISLRGVGRVDLLVDGWLIVECDSRAFHGDVAQQIRDRRRDLAAAELGYVTLRILAEDVFHRPDAVRAALGAVLARKPRGSSRASSD
ncbi:type IV toxin-antitoxin system AbiEi family antitoxin domain-containing protein [Microbacterium sp. CIAB417]|uniref:type IV toxin-antitoxin system AbiEi family antitoxin domain-containing protein n=1 Tax=Microbacterium sp. CIAB417 TaxID=2860287 RepID=UPI001FADF99B|nr:type IV toxin-antitoxin system AbiEi family antitoxin domain-containing protein [Microbacterium sp. CIAB417]